MPDSPEPVLVIGADDVGRRVCSLLRQAGQPVVHLDLPTDAELQAALQGPMSAVAVLLHDDIRALRYSLLVEHAKPGVRLFVAIFDRTVRQQIQAHVPNCIVLSPASIAVPSMVAAAIAPDALCIRRRESAIEPDWVAIDADGAPTPFTAPVTMRRRGRLGVLAGQLRSYDTGSAVLLGGGFGLIAVIVIDTLIGLQHASLLRALYDATRTTATISSPDLGEEPWHLLWATIAALLVMGFTAMFAAGIVQHLLSGRHIALIGRRVLPRSGHVVIIGMGQVGLRLAQELRALGIAVLGVDRYASASGVGLARDLGIPVLIGDATSRRTLTRAGLGRALALVAAGSEERDNIAVAVSAVTISDTVPIVLRAGSDDAIDETRSLFRIGPVVDVNGLTAAFVTTALLGSTPYAVVDPGDGVRAIAADGRVLSTVALSRARCTCLGG